MMIWFCFQRETPPDFILFLRRKPERLTLILDCRLGNSIKAQPISLPGTTPGCGGNAGNMAALRLRFFIPDKCSKVLWLKKFAFLATPEYLVSYLLELVAVSI
jgi:hypothetical protein